MSGKWLPTLVLSLTIGACSDLEKRVFQAESQDNFKFNSQPVIVNSPLEKRNPSFKNRLFCYRPQPGEYLDLGLKSLEEVEEKLRENIFNDKPEVAWFSVDKKWYDVSCYSNQRSVYLNFFLILDLINNSKENTFLLYHQHNWYDLEHKERIHPPSARDLYASAKFNYRLGNSKKTIIFGVIDAVGRWEYSTDYFFYRSSFDEKNILEVLVQSDLLIRQYLDACQSFSHLEQAKLMLSLYKIKFKTNLQYTTKEGVKLIVGE